MLRFWFSSRREAPKDTQPERKDSKYGSFPRQLFPKSKSSGQRIQVCTQWNDKCFPDHPTLSRCSCASSRIYHAANSTRLLLLTFAHHDFFSLFHLHYTWYFKNYVNPSSSSWSTHSLHFPVFHKFGPKGPSRSPVWKIEKKNPITFWTPPLPPPPRRQQTAFQHQTGNDLERMGGGDAPHRSLPSSGSGGGWREPSNESRDKELTPK